MSAEPAYDIVVRGGKIVDGTGMPSFLGDIAIKDGKIAELGVISGKGRKEIDATGLIVAPGAIDVHTHYDAQLNWDPYASQSCWHGITSIVVSCCGFGFAPCRPEDRERSMRRMTRVEAIPYEAMKLGMKWDWVTQRDYLAALERQGIGMNVAAYIPQTAIRAYVMGEDDNKRAEATPAELEEMKELVRDGYRAGCLGLSTDFNLIDRDFDGCLLPSLVAPMSETEALIAVAKEFNVGSIEVTPGNADIEDYEIGMLKRFHELSGRPICYNAVFVKTHKPDGWKIALNHLNEANKTHRIYSVSVAHGTESIFDLLNYNLFDDMPAWNSALAAPVPERIDNLRNPEVRAKLQHDLDFHTNRFWSGRWDKMKVFEAKEKRYEGKYIAQIAADEGKRELDVFCDIAVGDELKTVFLIEDATGDDQDAISEIMKSPYVVPGLSDGGAHTQFLCLGKYPTVVLSKFVRDLGVLTLEEAHWRMSYMSAATLGLEGIGTLTRGAPADIIVYDLEKLAVTPDNPYFDEIIGGAKRVIQKSTGYRYVIVNGGITQIDGESTGELPGRILRTAAYVPDQEPLLEAAE